MLVLNNVNVAVSPCRREGQATPSGWSLAMLDEELLGRACVSLRCLRKTFRSWVVGAGRFSQDAALGSCIHLHWILQNAVLEMHS